ncbi:hypothetical protein F4824DRAFT_500077 [Ustulina deusta]|nr:hypothetical protein F4824DRAFT_500077 [Ustulina deusta]
MSVRTASCLCGGIKIEIRGTPFMQNLCHCSSCQKSTGAPFGSLAAYKTEVRITVLPPSTFSRFFVGMGSPALRTRDLAPPIHTRPSFPDNDKQVTFTESEPSVLKTYIDTSPESGGVLKRSFCGKCGSPVGIQRGSNPDTLVLPIGIIDGNKDAFKPQLEFFCRSKADWVGAIQDSKTFDAMPPTNPPQ